MHATGSPAAIEVTTSSGPATRTQYTWECPSVPRDPGEAPFPPLLARPGYTTTSAKNQPGRRIPDCENYEDQANDVMFILPPPFELQLAWTQLIFSLYDSTLRLNVELNGGNEKSF
jgi:hypothetical protein